MPRFWDEWRWRAKRALLDKELSALRRDHELEVIRSLPEIGFETLRSTGVLLSDEIERYARDYRLISPFNGDKLKPAAYELSVGCLYSIAGKTHELTDAGSQNEIVIPPFEVVIIQTLERLNLPTFLIARWNVRVRWAYKGLLWVGAAQVDPGFRGYLSCPLYNLSDKPVRLHYGEEIAVIDFVTTTPPTEKSRKYNPAKRSRVLFEDYEPNSLKSALATQAREKIEVFERRINEIQGTVSNSVGIIFTAIGVLVAALALFVSKQIPDAVSNFSPSLIVSTIALVVSFFALVSAQKALRPSRSWFALQVLGWLVVASSLIWVCFRAFR
jgi:deoxycytidine triphosphate deaminase